MEITRGDLLTYQEHCLAGSTLGEGYPNDPYRPIGVILGKISVEESQRLRQEKEEGKLWNVLVGKWGVKGDWGVATLENLEIETSSQRYGHTKSDPILIEVFEEPSLRLKNMEFPFSRSTPRIEIKR